MFASGRRCCGLVVATGLSLRRRRERPEIGAKLGNALDQAGGGDDQPPAPAHEMRVADGIEGAPRELRSDGRQRDSQRHRRGRQDVGSSYEQLAEIDDLEEVPERLDGFVATVCRRARPERTKKTSRTGPETPAVSCSAVQRKPQQTPWTLLRMSGAMVRGTHSPAKDSSASVISAPGLLGTSSTGASSSAAVSAPPA